MKRQPAADGPFSYCLAKGHPNAFFTDVTEIFSIETHKSNHSLSFASVYCLMYPLKDH